MLHRSDIMPSCASSPSTSTAYARRRARACSTGCDGREPTWSACRRPRPRSTSSPSTMCSLPGTTASTATPRRRATPGVALYTRQEPEQGLRGFGVEEFDREGRYLEAQVGELSVVSLYLPSGSAGPERQASKDSASWKPSGRTSSALRKTAARVHPLRRLEHRPQGDRSQELARQPEELRLPARGARLDG